MKVIDLLNKIANGEEVPKKIKYTNKIFEHWDNGNIQDYWHEGNKSFFDDFIDCSKIMDLNYELEIIEEEKDIEELPNYVDCNENTGLACSWSFSEEILKNKINELVKAVNELKKEIKWNF